MTWRNPMNILTGAHRLMVGECFSLSKVYYKCYVNVLRVFKRNSLCWPSLFSFKGK